MSSTGTARIPENPDRAAENSILENALTIEDSGAQPSLLPHLRLFWSHRRFLFRTGVYALIASVLIALLIPSEYQGVTRLMPPDSQSSSGLGMLAAMAGRAGAAGGLGALAGDLLGMKSSGALFVGILGSQTIEDHLIDEFQLQKVYFRRKAKMEDVRKALSEHTSVGEDRKSGIITIAVTDRDPQRAAAMAQAYVTELDRLVAQLSTSSARRERIFLEERLQKVKAGLDTAARDFSNFASKNTAIDIPAQGKAMVEAAATLQGQLIASEAELSGLRQIYTDNNVRVRAAEARVGELKKKLNEVGGVGSQAEIKSENSLYPSIRKLPLLGVTYADLYRQTKIQETVYELLTEQCELAKVQEAKEIPTVKVLDVATVPTKKSFPPRALITLFGGVLGLALAMTWVSGKARWDSVEPGNPRKVFAREVLTSVQEYVPGFSRNGSSVESNGHRTWAFWKKTGDDSRENPENHERDPK